MEPKEEQVLEDDTTKKMLFMEGVQGLDDDEFEGSKKERDVFMEVFFGKKNGGDATNIMNAASLSTFPCSYENHPSKSLASFSSIVSPMKNTLSESDCVLGTSSCQAGSGADSGKCNDNKEENQSPLNASNGVFGLDQSLPSTSALKQNPPNLQGSAPCYIVEASGYGILSGYYFKNQDDVTGGVDTTGNAHANSHCKIHDDKDSTLEINVATAAPLVSQDNFDVGLGVAGACKGYIETKELALELEQVNIANKKANFRDLPSRLNSFGTQLLADSGWQIQTRVRCNRTKLGFYFIPPKRRPVVTSFVQAWKLCGGELHWHAADSEVDKTGREWTNIDSFWADLIETLFYIEKVTQSAGDSISLLQRWQLLDPFIAVVCVDRRINILREGSKVKALNSTAVVLCGSDNTSLANKGVGILDTSATPSSHSNKILNYDIPVAQAENMLDDISDDLHVAPHSHDPQGKKSCKQGKRKHHRCAEPQERINHKRHEKCIENILNDDNFSHQSGVPVTPVVEISPVHDQSSGRFSFSTGSSYIQEVKEVMQPNLLISESNKLSNKLTPKRTYSDEDGINADRLSAGKMQIPNEQSDEQRLDLLPGISDGSCGMVTASSPEKMNSSANQVTSSCKEPHKKSKRMSQIGMTENGTTCNENYQESVTCHVHEKSQNHCEGACNLEMSHGTWNSMSQELEENSCGSLVVQTCSTAKVVKNAIKSGKRVSKQQGKQKKTTTGLQSEDKLIDCLSGVDKDQEDVSSSKRVKCEVEGLCSKPLVSFRKPRKKMSSTQESIDHNSVDCEVSAAVSIAADNQKSDQQDNLTVAKKKREACKKNLTKRPRGYRINDDDLLIASILKRKDYGSCNKVSFSKVGPSKRKSLGKFESRKGGPRLLLRAPGKSGKYSNDGQDIIFQARTVLNWLIHMGAVTLKDMLQYRNPKYNALVKEGKITRSGIVCNCCTKVLSVSDFKVHAGSKSPKTSNLFLQSGRSYILCQIQAWSAEYASRKDKVRVKVEELDKNDDTCGICGDGGELICCDNCPSTYHEACLPGQDIPDGSWYCHNCVCRCCGDVAREQEGTLSMVLQCSQCERKYHDICIKEKVGKVGSDTWFCGRDCQMVFLGLRSRVGESNYLGDGYSWSILRCNHDDKKVYSAQKIAHMAECNTKLAVALTVMEECFMPMVDPRTGIDMIPHVVYNWGSDFARLNYQGFYTVILENGDELISVASLRVHGFTVAEIPLVMTCSEHRRQGMGRKLMDAIEKILKSLKVKSVVLSAISDVADTWINGFGFKPIKDDEKRQLSQVNLMLFPGTLLLIKNLDAPPEESGGDGVCPFRVTQTQNLDADDSINDIETAHQGDNSVTTKLCSEGIFPTRETLNVQDLDTKQQGSPMISDEVLMLVDGDHHNGAVGTSESFSASHLSSEGQAVEDGTFHSVDESNTMRLCSSFSISSEDNQYLTEPTSGRSNSIPQDTEPVANTHLNADKKGDVINFSEVKDDCPANREAGDGNLTLPDLANGKLEEVCGKKFSLDASNGIRSSGMCM